MTLVAPLFIRMDDVLMAALGRGRTCVVPGTIAFRLHSRGVASPIWSKFHEQILGKSVDGRNTLETHCFLISADLA